MPRLVHFDIHATDPEQAMAFYEGAFGWTFEKWDGPMDYWLAMTGPEDEPGIDGGLARREGPAPDPDAPFAGFECTLDVPDLDSALELVEEHGGAIAREKDAIPGVGWLAYVTDPDGNRLGLMEADETAGTDEMAAGEPAA